MEAGLYVGGFISNYFHQFYELDKFTEAATARCSTR